MEHALTHYPLVVLYFFVLLIPFVVFGLCAAWRGAKHALDKPYEPQRPPHEDFWDKWQREQGD